MATSEEELGLVSEKHEVEEEEKIGGNEGFRSDSWRTLILKILNCNWIPDKLPRYPPTVVKGIKFFLLNMILFPFSHFLIHSNPSLDQNLRIELKDLYKYDFQLVVLDSMWFFIVGRLWQEGRKGVDTIGYVSVVIIGVWFFSAISSWKWAQHSLTMYDIMCAWEWQLFVLAISLVVVISALVAKHVVDAYRDGILAGRLAEIGLTFALLILPAIFDSNFHLHHWLESFFLGQHANFPYSYSVYTQAFLWGGYLNGIVAWGRGSVVGCKEVYWRSLANGCGFVQDCYCDDDDFGDDDYAPLPPFVSQDWRNCSAG